MFTSTAEHRYSAKCEVFRLYESKKVRIKQNKLVMNRGRWH